MRAFVFFKVKEKVACAHALNRTLECFSSTPGLGVKPNVEAVEQDLLVAHPVIDILA